MTNLLERRSAMPEKDDPSGRCPTRRDRDRILYSDTFRRLGGVTQVAAGNPESLLHSRLTHSLKVEQLGSAIHTLLAKNDFERFLDKVDFHAVCAACLAHDLGHPPFGHIGEKTLNEILVCSEHLENPRTPEERIAETCSRCLLEDGFEGNAQTFRIVTALAPHRAKDSRSPIPVGLDLTRSTLQAVSKYPWLRGTRGRKKIKWGAYDCDSSTLRWVFGKINSDPTAAAQVMDLADDVTYAVHDLEDFFRNGYVPLENYNRRNQVGSGTNELYLDFMGYVEDQDRIHLSDEVKRAIGNYVEFFPKARFSGSASDMEALDYMRSSLITMFTRNTTYVKGRVVRDSLADCVCEVMKQLLWFHVIDSPDLSAIQAGQVRVIREIFTGLKERLFAAFLDVPANKKAGEKKLRSLPPGLRRSLEVINRQGARGYRDRKKRLMRALTDYVASLGDFEAYHIHASIMGSEKVARLAPR